MAINWHRSIPVSSETYRRKQSRRINEMRGERKKNSLRRCNQKRRHYLKFHWNLISCLFIKEDGSWFGIKINIRRAHFTVALFSNRIDYFRFYYWKCLMELIPVRFSLSVSLVFFSRWCFVYRFGKCLAYCVRGLAFGWCQKCSCFGVFFK